MSTASRLHGRQSKRLPNMVKNHAWMRSRSPFISDACSLPDTLIAGPQVEKIRLAKREAIAQTESMPTTGDAILDSVINPKK